MYRAIKSSTVTKPVGYTGSKQVSSSDIAPMGIEDVRASVQNILAGKYIAKMGIIVISVSVQNVLACRNLLHAWE